jgi:hypothetical protein
MPTYTLSNTADDIDWALTRVVSADSEPTNLSQNMVSSHGVKSYVDGRDALKLSLSGDTMSGSIAMGNNAITGLVDPTDNADAATKGYVDQENETLKSYVDQEDAALKSYVDQEIANAGGGGGGGGGDVEFNGSVLICINGSPYYIDIPYDSDTGVYAASAGANFPISAP